MISSAGKFHLLVTWVLAVPFSHAADRRDLHPARMAPARRRVPGRCGE